MKQPITLETAIDLLQTFAVAAECALSNTPDWRIILNNALHEYQLGVNGDGQPSDVDLDATEGE